MKNLDTESRNEVTTPLASIIGPVEKPAEPAPEFDVKAYLRHQRMERFKGFCPEEFRKPINEALIPNLAAWREADAWAGTYPGCWIWSNETGRCKTRMFWRKYGQCHVERGLAVLRISGLNLGEAYHDAHNKSATSRFYADMTCVSVVMLDDLDKLVLPEDGQGFGESEDANRNARMLRELFDRFYQHHTRVLVTANENIAWFTQRIGPSAERRMRAVCNEIQF